MPFNISLNNEMLILGYSMHWYTLNLIKWRDYN